MKKDLIQTAKIIALGAILALGVSFAHAVWVGPTAPPPLNNASAPLNVGTSVQVKDGGLGVTSLLADEVLVDNGNGNAEVCLNGNCISAWPSAAAAADETVPCAFNNIIRYNTERGTRQSCKDGAWIDRGNTSTYVKVFDDGSYTIEVEGCGDGKACSPTVCGPSEYIAGITHESGVDSKSRTYRSVLYCRKTGY